MNWRRGVRGALASLAGCCVFAAAGCDPVEMPRASNRAERYGIFRDLRFVPGDGERIDGFFIDLFESTQEDWLSYRASVGESVGATTRFLQRWGETLDGALPVVGIDLDEARAFARWRFGRLPRFEEWEFTATARGRYGLPWGNLPRTEYANTAELRYGRLVPVGMFESARQSGGAYDLIGNAAEWTESTVVEWRSVDEQNPDPMGDPLDLGWRLEAVARHPALRPWWMFTRVPLPSFHVLQVERDAVARRLTIGAGEFMRPPSEVVHSARPNERSSLLGVRVAADPAGLLGALIAQREPPPRDGELLLRRFLRRNREHLESEWRSIVDAADGPLATILREELGG